MIAVALLLCLASAASAYVLTARALAPKITSVRIAACGLPAKEPGFGVPLRALMAGAPGVPVRFGPIAVSGMAEPIYLEFDPTIDGRSGQALRQGDTLRLPVTGAGGLYPEQIMLICRAARVATIQYRLEPKGRMSLEVVEIPPGSP